MYESSHLFFLSRFCVPGFMVEEPQADSQADCHVECKYEYNIVYLYQFQKTQAYFPFLDTLSVWCRATYRLVGFPFTEQTRSSL